MNRISLQKPQGKLLALSIAAALTGASGISQAGGFQLYSEANAVNQGNYAAGVAAEVTDASIGFYNPAGLTRIKKEQIVVAGNLVSMDDKFTGINTWSTAMLPGVTYTQTANGINGGGNHVLPAIHYAKPLTDSITFGLSVTVPFGLTTEYADTSPVRYAATKTSLMTVDVSPEIGGKITDKLSMGVGFNFQYADVTYNGVVGVPILPPGPPAALDTTLTNNLTSFAVGAHVGLLYEFTPQTRVGINYQSAMSHNFMGTSTLSGPLSMAASGSIVSDYAASDMDFPATTTLSGYHELNDKVALLGSVVYTQWSTFNTITLRSVAAAPTFTTLAVPQNFRNTWRFAAGINYKLNDRVLLRGGGGYEQTPTNNIDRSLRLPDTDRIALAVGARVQVNDNVSVDAGWTHFFTDDVPINNTFAAAGTMNTTVGTIKGRADLFGAQVNWNIT